MKSMRNNSYPPMFETQFIILIPHPEHLQKNFILILKIRKQKNSLLDTKKKMVVER